MPLLLPELDILLAALVALAVCLLVVAFTKAFFGTVGGLLGKLPVVGGWIEATGDHIAQRIANVFGGFAAKLEAVVGASWHSTARIVDKLGGILAKHSGLLGILATYVPGAGVLGNLYRAIQLGRQIVHQLAQHVVGIGHDIVIRTRTIERGIGNDVLPRIRGLDRELNRVLGKTIPGLRTGERTLSRELDALRKWTHKHVLVAGTVAFTAAVAAALAALGLSWIRCPTAKRVFDKRGCNMWNDLDALLGLTVAAVAVEDLRTLVKILQGIESEAVKGIEAVLKV